MESLIARITQARKLVHYRRCVICCLGKMRREIDVVDVSVRVPAIEKIIDYAASGIGSVAGSMLAPWMARREAEANLIAARGDAAVLGILAAGQADALPVITAAREKARQLAAPGTIIRSELTMADAIEQRVLFQEEKRIHNIGAIINRAADQLADSTVLDHEPDHDWTARFFGEAQDVSSEQMQILWAKVLSGEVRHQGSTSIRTITILRSMDRDIAEIFSKLCSLSIYVYSDSGLEEARVLTLGRTAASNSLRDYGLSFRNLNLLNEYGLIDADYNTRMPIRQGKFLLFQHQGSFWRMMPTNHGEGIDGVSLSRSGRELSKVIELVLAEEYTRELERYLDSRNITMEKAEPPP